MDDNYNNQNMMNNGMYTNNPNAYNGYYNNQYNNPYYNNGNDINYNNRNYSKKSNKSLKIVFLILLLFLVAIVITFVFLFLNQDKKNRTVMIYMVGSDLETKSGYATLDLDNIDLSNIDYENNNVILMAGGAKLWHNDFNNDEVAIYELSSNGFDKMMSYPIDTMGEEKFLTTFLNYCKENYRAKKYDLIFWNHGSGAYGLEKDDIYNDMITLPELSKALKNSPFDSSNKLDSVLFINCLLANLQIADVIDDYADFMIASEEISYVSPQIDKLSFLENIEASDNGYEFGKKFIDVYADSINELNRKGSKLDSTYSIIDLSKIDDVYDELDRVVSNISLNTTNYRKIANVRAKIETYGKTLPTYDTVDMYNFIKNISRSLNINTDRLLNAIESCVLYNWSLNDYSNGLSTYFPYYGNSKYFKLHFDGFSKIEEREYYSFIEEFANIKYKNLNSISTYRKTPIKDDLTFTLNLSEEEKNVFSRASVIVFQKEKEDSYIPLYMSQNLFLDESSNLSFTYSGKALKVIDKKDGSYGNILLIEKEKGKDYTIYQTYGLLQNEEGKSLRVEIYITVDNEHPNGYISSIIERGDEENPGMGIVDLNNYTDLFFTNFNYDILDESLNYKENWDSKGTSFLFKVGTSKDDFTFELSPIDDDIEYTCVFKIYDVDNNYIYSPLVNLDK